MDSHRPVGPSPEPAAGSSPMPAGRPSLGPPPPPPPPPAAYSRQLPPKDAMAVLAFVLGLFAVVGGVFCLVPGPICGIPAVVVGLVSQRRISSAGGGLGGSGLALAGWICGIAGILVAAIYVVLFLAGALALGNLDYLSN
jgi:hypothetical protein